jgi:hypothetical protein
VKNFPGIFSRFYFLGKLGKKGDFAKKHQIPLFSFRYGEIPEQIIEQSAWKSRYI